MEFEDYLDETQKLDSEKAEGVDHKENSYSTPADRFTELMFGNRASGGKQENHRNDQQNHSKNDEIPNDEVNYFTLMEQIDDIIVSLKNLKPILNQLSPIMDYIKKKI